MENLPGAALGQALKADFQGSGKGGDRHENRGRLRAEQKDG